jgi:hypothetical protein
MSERAEGPWGIAGIIRYESRVWTAKTANMAQRGREKRSENACFGEAARELHAETGL